MRRSVSRVVLAGLLFAAAGCKEEGTINVRSIKFTGVEAVDAVRALSDALATRQSSKLPWGRKAFFDRSRFDADLKRIQAFYADRGYPDARVTGFDVKLNDKQDAVDLTVTIAEGEPVRVAAIELRRLRRHSAGASRRREEPGAAQGGRAARPPAGRDDARAGAQRAEGSRLSVREGDTDEETAPDGKTAALTFTAEPGKLAHFGPIEIQGNKCVSTRVIERELTFKPGDLYRRSLLQDSQRRLYGLELFQFANIEPLNTELQPDRGADAGHGRRRQPSARQLRRRLRHRRKGARRRRISPSSISWAARGRRAHMRAGRRSIAASGSISTSRIFSPRISRWAAKGSSGTRSRPRINRS